LQNHKVTKISTIVSHPHRHPLVRLKPSSAIQPPAALSPSAPLHGIPPALPAAPAPPIHFYDPLPPEPTPPHPPGRPSPPPLFPPLAQPAISPLPPPVPPPQLPAPPLLPRPPNPLHPQPAPCRLLPRPQRSLLLPSIPAASRRVSALLPIHSCRFYRSLPAAPFLLPSPGQRPCLPPARRRSLSRSSPHAFSHRSRERPQNTPFSPPPSALFKLFIPIRACYTALFPSPSILAPHPATKPQIAPIRTPCRPCHAANPPQNTLPLPPHMSANSPAPTLPSLWRPIPASTRPFPGLRLTRNLGMPPPPEPKSRRACRK